MVCDLWNVHSSQLFFFPHGLTEATTQFEIAGKVSGWINQSLGQLNVITIRVKTRK